jgi:hypothetical protein
MSWHLDKFYDFLTLFSFYTILKKTGPQVWGHDFLTLGIIVLLREPREGWIGDPVKFNN